MLSPCRHGGFPALRYALGGEGVLLGDNGARRLWQSLEREPAAPGRGGGRLRGLQQQRREPPGHSCGGGVALTVTCKKAKKTEEEVHKEVGIVMGQLAKLTADSQQTVHTMLRKYAKAFGPPAALGVLKELVRRGDWRRSLEALHCLRVLPWFEPDPLLYAGIIGAMGRAAQPDEAFSLFEAMGNHGCPPSTSVYTAIIDALGRSGDGQQVLFLFEEMKCRPGCEPDESTYSSVMRFLSRRGQVFEAEALMQEMQEERWIPATEVHYNILLDGWGRLGDIQRMQETFLAMTRARLLPDVWTYNALVRNYGKSGLIDKMEACFENMQQNGCPPDEKTFNHLIEAYGKAGQLEKMSLTLKHMKYNKYKLGLATFNLAIDAYSRAQMLPEVDNTFSNMKAARIRPNAVTFCALMRCYGQMGKIQKVRGLVEEMASSQVPIHGAVLASALGAFVKKEAWEDADTFLADVIGQGGCPLNPDTLLTIVETYGRSGAFAQLMSHMRKFQAHGVKPTIAVYNAAMVALSRSPEEVDLLWKELQRSGLQPDGNTFLALVTAFSQAGLWEQVDECLKEMQSLELAPSEELIGVLVTKDEAAGWPQKAEEVRKWADALGISRRGIATRRRTEAHAKGSDAKQADRSGERRLGGALVHS